LCGCLDQRGADACVWLCCGSWICELRVTAQ
jgi:hypothetical protein